MDVFLPFYVIYDNAPYLFQKRVMFNRDLSCISVQQQQLGRRKKATYAEIGKVS